MTTTKRCEVCGKEKCFEHGKPQLNCSGASAYCHGHPKPTEEKCLCGEWWSSKCPVHPDPTPSAPTPSEVEMLVKGREWDEIKGVLGTFSQNQHRVREAYEEALKHIEIAVSSLLLSYGKEREKEMWRKCREAVEKSNDEWVIKNGASVRRDALSALDSVNPER